ncbi:MAG: hypothetical protein H6Q07_2870 [Acidobacteria bacterium]|nr:hypothetical protein [Acidobacteriota bacterium]
MPAKNCLKLFAAIGLALGLFLSGCSKQESPTEGDQLSAEEKVAQAEKELEKAKKELATTRQEEERGEGVPAKPQAQSVEAPPAPPVQPRTVSIPSGTTIPVRTIATLSTKTHKAGEPFEAILNETLEIDGVVIARRGAAVTGIVSNSDPGGRAKGVASITLNLKSIRAESGDTLAITTQSFSKNAPTSKKKDVKKIGIATGVGAAIGAIAGGGKGAAIGAGVGAAGGTGLVVATHGDPAVVPVETLLSFRLAAPVSYTEKR